MSYNVLMPKRMIRYRREEMIIAIAWCPIAGGKLWHGGELPRRRTSVPQNAGGKGPPKLLMLKLIVCDARVNNQ